MTAIVSPPPSAEAERVISAVLDDLRHGSHLGVVVDSPPGAGKSRLVVRASLTLAADRSHVRVVAQTNEQVDDLVHRLALAAAPGVVIGRLSGAEYVPSQRVAHQSSILVAKSVGDLRSAAVIVGTAAKGTFVNDGHGPWGIVDQAKQKRAAILLRVAPRFHRAL